MEYLNEIVSSQHHKYVYYISYEWWLVGGSSSITLQISRIGWMVGMSALNGLVFVAIKFQDFVNLLLAANERWREKRVDLPQNSVILGEEMIKLNQMFRCTVHRCVCTYTHIVYARDNSLVRGHVKLLRW